MLNFNSVLVSSANAAELTDFYRGIFGPPAFEGGGYSSFAAGSGYITIGPHDQVSGRNPNPERILLNFETSDVQAEFERIKGLGARVVAAPYQMDETVPGWIATFADPDGNYFQVMTPFEMG